MCVVSMIADHYYEKWRPKTIPPWTPVSPATPLPAPSVSPLLPTPEEIEEFRELMRKAREYDKRTGQPNCESPEKLARLRELAKEIGDVLKDI